MKPATAKKYIAGTTEDGRNIYHCLRWCNRIKRNYWFTLDADSIDAESRMKLGKQFDVRDIPDQFDTKGMAPIDAAIHALNNGWEPTYD